MDGCIIWHRIKFVRQNVIVQNWRFHDGLQHDRLVIHIRIHVLQRHQQRLQELLSRIRPGEDKWLSVVIKYLFSRFRKYFVWQAQSTVLKLSFSLQGEQYFS